MSKQAAGEIIRLTQLHKNPVVCTASGDTPTGVYKKIINIINKEHLNISDWIFIGLDEWIGMNGNDEGSCRYYLDQQLFQPLQVVDEKICFFDGRAKNLEAECERVENFISQHGGIDIAILGLGMNGHIGMNEPGTSKYARSHVSELDVTTQQVGQKYFKNQQTLSRGITLGTASLLEARHIILLVSGNHKAGIVQQIIEGEISEQLPASLLRLHPELKIYLDMDAAANIMRPLNEP
jgi:galactosamine-6-phosphate isomerase